MGEATDPLTTDSTTAAITHGGLLIVMAALVGVGTLAGFVFAGGRFGFGVLFGGVLAFANYLWLDRSTRAIFSQTAMASSGILAAKYILRYVVLGLVLLVVYLTEALPLAAVILGLAAFAIAVVLQGLKNIISSSI
jgi:hypothetical protein